MMEFNRTRAVDKSFWSGLGLVHHDQSFLLGGLFTVLENNTFEIFVSQNFDFLI